MKTMNYIKIGIASSILSIAAGCTSFLEEDLKSSLAPDNTYTSSLGFEVGATGLYAMCSRGNFTACSAPLRATRPPG